MAKERNVIYWLTGELYQICSSNAQTFVFVINGTEYSAILQKVFVVCIVHQDISHKKVSRHFKMNDFLIWDKR